MATKKLKPVSTMTRGEKVCAFIEAFCLAPEGEHIGKPIVLEDFQRRFLLDIYDNPLGTHTAILSIARKNGKTALIGGMLLAHLCGPEAVQNSQIVRGRSPKNRPLWFLSWREKWLICRPSCQSWCESNPAESG
jgi:hypothetical protein